MKSSLYALKGTAIVMSILILTITNCKKMDMESFNPGDPDKADSLLLLIVNDTICKDFYLTLKQLPYLIQVAPSPKTNVGDPIVEPGSTQVCTTQRVKWAAEYDELNLLDPKSEVIYPTAPIDATSVKTGAYTPLSNIQRGPSTISISLLTQPGTKPYRVVEEPNLATIRDAVNELLHDVSPGSTPAFINFDIEEIRTQEELEIGIKANFKGYGAKVSTAFDFATTEKKSRLLIKFYQKYYTIDMNLPNTPCEYFKSGELPEISQFDGTCPVYVSSVTYGRMVYFMMESSASTEDMKIALNATFNYWGTKSGVDASYEQKQMISNAHTSALIVGGNADNAVNAVTGVQGVIDYITADGDFSATSPGVPIAYTMRYLKDNSVANIVLNSEYTIRNCADIPATTEEFTPEPIMDVRLNKINGDTEFDGWGPDVTFSCALTHDDKEIRAIIKVNMKETPDGHTTEGDITFEKIIWTCPADRKLESINSRTTFPYSEPPSPPATFNYRDTNITNDIFDFPISDLVSYLEFKGDTDGGDLGHADIEEDAHLHLLKFNKISISTKPR